MADLLTALSILVALLTWLFTHLHARREARRSLTGQLAGNFSVNPMIADSNLEVIRLIDAGVSFDDDALDWQAQRHLIVVLNYYEFLCRFCKIKALDQKTILGLRGRPMVQVYEAAKVYIEKQRQRLGYPELYACLQEMVDYLRRVDGE